MTAAPEPDRDRCPSCRVLWTQHMGIQGTCAELLEATKEIERLKASQAEAVRAAVEEERERCVTIVNTADVFGASEYIGEIVVSAGEITARILKAPQ